MADLSEIAECERMIAFLQSQVKQLAEMKHEAEVRLNQWTQKLEVARAGKLIPNANGRAPRGALQAAIEDALKQSSMPMTTAEIEWSVSKTLHDFNPRSIWLALRKLEKLGVAEESSGRWAAKI